MTNKTNRKIETLVDAISFAMKAHNADSLAYELRNPLLLKSFSRPGRHEINEDGIRVFDSHIGGYKAAYWDIEKKLSGESNSGLLISDKLKNLLNVLKIFKEEDINSVVHFLRKALKDPSINLLTPLSYFKENL